MDVRHLVKIGLVAAVLAVVPAHAQDQQAGNEASANADETFEKLIEQCDNTDVLVLRARIRLLISRTTPEAAAEAQGMLDQGLAQCGEGKIDEAKVTLEQAMAVADQGSTEKFGAEGVVEAEEEVEPEEKADGDKPWWKFW